MRPPSMKKLHEQIAWSNVHTANSIEQSKNILPHITLKHKTPEVSVPSRHAKSVIEKYKQKISTSEENHAVSGSLKKEAKGVNARSYKQ
ncbi:hypothetical protein Tco_0071017 [Tanacetum coccineum]